MPTDETSSITRRSALAGLGVGLVGLAIGSDIFSIAPAQAAVAWCSPFTTRGSVYSPGGEYSSLPSGHNGVDFNNAIHPGGTIIRSCAAGTVTRATNGDSIYGTLVEISHGDGYKTFYGHMRNGSIPQNVYVGASLAVSTPIGLVGGTPNGYAEHLHLGLLYNGSKADPTFLVTTAPLALATPMPMDITQGEILEMLYSVTGTSTDGVVLGGMYIQGPDGPLRYLNSHEYNARFSKYPNEPIVSWSAFDLRQLVKIVGLRQYGAPQGLLNSYGTPIGGDGRLTGTIIY